MYVEMGINSFSLKLACRMLLWSLIYSPRVQCWLGEQYVDQRPVGLRISRNQGSIRPKNFRCTSALSKGCIAKGGLNLHGLGRPISGPRFYWNEGFRGAEGLFG